MVKQKKDVSKEMLILLQSYKPLFLSLARQPRYSLIRDEVLSISYCTAVKVFKECAGSTNTIGMYLKQGIQQELNNALRKAQTKERRECMSLDISDHLPQLIVTDEDIRIKKMLVQEAWKKLLPEEKRLLQLYFGQQKTQKEIATILRIRRDTVATKLAQVLRKLRANCL